MCKSALKNPKLSVLMITYNQEKYIAQALDSVLMQEVHFDYEIVIGEDCSTDGTRKILLEYQQKHPERIRLLLPEKNLGMLPNFMQTYLACEGEYVAILEGDDFWTDATKLQKQVEFLDNHRECAICFHTAKAVFEHGDAPDYLFPENQKQFSSIDDLIALNFIPTCSVMFRNKLFGPFPEWFRHGVMGDYPLHILNAHHGLIGYIDEAMSVYRIHSAGVWSMQAEKNLARNYRAEIKMFRNLDAHLDRKYHAQVQKKIYRYELGLYKWYMRNKSPMLALKQLIRLVLRHPVLVVIGKIEHELSKRKCRV